jgi:hypothetical protein
MIIKYKCENDDCPRKDEVVEVKPEQSSECRWCGWFMTAIW